MVCADIELDVYRNQDRVLAALRGRLTLASVAEMRERLLQLVEPTVTQMYLGLGALEYLDSSGLGMLIAIKMSATRTCTSLAFLAPPPRVMDVLRISKLDGILEIIGGAEADAINESLRKAEYLVSSDRREATSEAGWATVGDDSGRGAGPVAARAESVVAGAGREERARRAGFEAMEYLRQGDTARAIATLERALEADPDNLMLLNNLGVILEKRPEWYERGLNLWRRALRLSQGLGDEKNQSRAERHIAALEKLMPT